MLTYGIILVVAQFEGNVAIYGEALDSPRYIRAGWETVSQGSGEAGSQMASYTSCGAAKRRYMSLAGMENGGESHVNDRCAWANTGVGYHLS